MEPRYAGLLPEVLLGLGPQQFAELAARAMQPRAQPEVAVDHVHGGTVSVREQTALLRERLRRTGGGIFRSLTADCAGTLEVVARFLGLLELYREGLVAFEQAEALGELHVRWTGEAGVGDRAAWPSPRRCSAPARGGAAGDRRAGARDRPGAGRRATDRRGRAGARGARATSTTEQGRGFELRSVAGGWRLYTRAECAPWVERFVLDGQSARLTQAALETLAVIAYRQPVTRARVSAVRGVNVDGVVRTLVSRGLIAEAGQDPDSAGTLYRTTPLLLERLGLGSLDELPALAPLLPELSELERRAHELVTTDHDMTDRRASACRRCSASAGIGSRRACEAMIEQGRVSVERRGRARAGPARRPGRRRHPRRHDAHQHRPRQRLPGDEQAARATSPR